MAKIGAPAAGGPTRTIKTARVSTGAVAGGAAVEVTVNWPTAFPDTNYTVPEPGIEEATSGANSLRLRHIVSKTAAAIVVRITNDDTLNAKTGTIHAVGIAD